MMPVLKKKPPYTLYVGIGVVVLVIIGLLASILLSGRNQDVRKDASVAGGTTVVTISPPAQTLQTNGSTTVSVSFNTNGSEISGIAARLSFPGPTAATGIAASNVVVNPTLLSDPSVDFSCPVKSASVAGGVTTVDVGCVVLGTQGYVSNTSTELFTFTVTARGVANTNPVVITFDPTNTVITDKATGQDIAAIPTGSTSITIDGVAATPTPPPATPTPPPASTPTPPPASTPTPPAATPTPPASAAPSSSPAPSKAPLSQCNGGCVANRDCANNLACVEGKCRAINCTSDTTCQCKDVNPGAGDGELPETGVMDHLVLLVFGGVGLMMTGFFFMKKDFLTDLLISRKIDDRGEWD